MSKSNYREDQLIWNINSVAFHLANPAKAFTAVAQLQERANTPHALREVYSSRNHTWRLWQTLSTRQQGTTEPLADLHVMFKHLHLSESNQRKRNRALLCSRFIYFYYYMPLLYCRGLKLFFCLLRFLAVQYSNLNTYRLTYGRLQSNH